MGYVLDILIVAVCVVFIVVGSLPGIDPFRRPFLGAVLAACLASALGAPGTVGLLTPCSARRWSSALESP